MRVRSQSTVNYNISWATAAATGSALQPRPLSKTVRTPQINLFGEYIYIYTERERERERPLHTRSRVQGKGLRPAFQGVGEAIPPCGMASGERDGEVWSRISDQTPHWASLILICPLTTSITQRRDHPSTTSYMHGLSYRTSQLQNVYMVHRKKPQPRTPQELHYGLHGLAAQPTEMVLVPRRLSYTQWLHDGWQVPYCGQQGMHCGFQVLCCGLQALRYGLQMSHSEPQGLHHAMQR